MTADNRPSTLDILKGLAKEFYDLSVQAESRSKHYEVGSVQRISWYDKSIAYSIALEAVNMQIRREIKRLQIESEALTFEINHAYD